MKRVKTITVRLSEDHHKYMFNVSQQKNISINDLFRKFINESMHINNILNTDETMVKSINQILINTNKLIDILAK